MNGMNPIALGVAAVQAAGALYALSLWLRAPRERGAVPALLAGLLWLGIALDVALGYAVFATSRVGLRYLLFYAGLVLGPLLITAGYTAVMSRRYRHAPQGMALLWLGTLCAVLLYLLIGRKRA
jgi:hypothetical protein